MGLLPVITCFEAEMIRVSFSGEKMSQGGNHVVDLDRLSTGESSRQSDRAKGLIVLVL